MGEYIIVGDTDRYESCLIFACGTKEHAEEKLQQLLNNPGDNDKAMIKGHMNLRVEKVEEKDCWWHGNCD